MALILLPMVMRSDAGGNSEVDVSGDTLFEVLCGLKNRYPALETRLFTGNDTLRPFVKVFLNKKDVSKSDLNEIRIEHHDRLHLVSAVAGG